MSNRESFVKARIKKWLAHPRAPLVIGLMAIPFAIAGYSIGSQVEYPTKENLLETVLSVWLMGAAVILPMVGVLVQFRQDAVPPGLTRVRLTALLSSDVVDALKELAKRRGTTMTEVIRSAISTENFFDEIMAKGGEVLVENARGEIRKLVFPSTRPATP